MTRILTFLFLLLILLSACQPAPEPKDDMLVTIVADGRKQTYAISEPLTVDEFLREVEVEVGETDRLSPPRFTQLSNGMQITIVRVSEENECEQEPIPFESQFVPNEGLAPGEERIAQSGKNGIREVCYRIIIEDGQRRDKVRTGSPTIIVAAQDQITYIGVDIVGEPVAIKGTLAYINNGNAWVINGNSTNKRPLTTTSDLDSFVLSLSADGKYIIYTTESKEDDTFINQLWLIPTSLESEPVKLPPTDILYADWIPGRKDTLAYSSAEPRQINPFWDALNNLWVMEIDTRSGDAINIKNLIQESAGGLYGWWGTVFEWSPDGQKLAWVRADSVGITNLEGNPNNYEPLIEYAVFNTSQPWSWRASVSWSPDGELLATTIHGLPLGNEPPERSPVFDVFITDLNQTTTASIQNAAGMWSAPKFSPFVNDGKTTYPRAYIAYLQAREPYNSIKGEYDLVVADRDGSNAKSLFPKPEQPGIISSDFGLTPTDFVWNPDGTQIALIYQGNVWVVDVESGVSHQLTFDGGASNPVWEN